MHKAVNRTIHVVFAICFLVLANINVEQGKQISKLEIDNSKMISVMAGMGKVITTNTNNISDIADVVNGLPENEEFIRIIVRRVVQNLPEMVIETENNLESAIEAANEAIAEVSEAISELEGEPLTFEQIEAIVDAQIEKENVKEDEYNTVVAETIMNLELRQEIESLIIQHNKPAKVDLTLEDFKGLVKTEVYEVFEEAGYGKVVDGKFIPKKPFFGAEIQEGDEHRYEPVTPFK